MSGLPLVPTRVSKRSLVAGNAGEGSFEGCRRIQFVALPCLATSAIGRMRPVLNNIDTAVGPNSDRCVSRRSAAQAVTVFPNCRETTWCDRATATVNVWSYRSQRP